MSGKARKSIKQGLGALGQHIASPFRSRSRSPSLSTRNAASGATNDLPMGRAATVSSHQNSQAGVAGHESLPSHSPEIGGTSNTRSRSTPPPQTVIPPIVINDGQTVEGGEISTQQGNPRPQSPNPEWVSELVSLILALFVLE